MPPEMFDFPVVSRKYLQRTSKRGQSWSMFCTRTGPCPVFRKSTRLGLELQKSAVKIVVQERNFMFCRSCNEFAIKSFTGCHLMQPLLIIWGEYDQIFPVELAHRLKRCYSIPRSFIVFAVLLCRKPISDENCFQSVSECIENNPEVSKSNRPFRLLTPQPI